MDGAKYVSATFLPSAGAGFHTVTPCRVVDTRDATGPYGTTDVVLDVNGFYR